MMKLIFRLKQLLEARNERGHGLIQRIADKTGLERHKVADLLQNKSQYLSVETLGRICDYLVHEHEFDPLQLPGILFSRAAEDFWDLLAQRDKLKLCLGMRLVEGEAMVTHADAYLQSAFLHGISSVSVVAKRNFGSLDQFLVKAPMISGEVQEKPRVEALYRDYRQKSSGWALVGLGSNKINPVSERIVAGCFAATPFEFDDVSHASERRSPIVLSYREEDPKVQSCCGDVRLSESEPFDRPGIYFEKKENDWECCPWEDRKRDAAFVLFDYQPNAGRLQMVLAGFSARASRCLADLLEHPACFWPPSYSRPNRKVGAFIVEFRFRSESDKKPRTKIIPLDESVLARRLEK